METDRSFANGNAPDPNLMSKNVDQRLLAESQTTFWVLV